MFNEKELHFCPAEESVVFFSEIHAATTQSRRLGSANGRFLRRRSSPKRTTLKYERFYQHQCPLPNNEGDRGLAADGT
ncbi:hypothetical protein RMSM_01519 [Rhodopirellula maiorica SM1]|uniref:Uncharacterized protein n=1 Tax=Rhodopirellula maiorica SM1 TaxID=1265738 RepID=M5S5S6_9BACT|nr:hypothetical protein RMSM_01519 [Rhodopirellula maiorica SM1]